MVKIGDEWDEVLIDSGAQVNTITLSHWRRICANSNSEIYNVILNPTATLHNYAGDKLKTTATFNADIEVGNGLRHLQRESFHVINKAKRGLLGYETAKRMGLISLGLDINAVEESLGIFPKIPNLKIKLEVDPNVPPVRNCNYRIPWALKKSTQRQLDKLFAQNIIEHAPANTKWMSKLSSVEKGTNHGSERGKEPERRLVVNMRPVNEAIIRVNHPMPYLENYLPKLSGAKYFAKLDLSSAFYHIELHEDSRNLTAFMTEKGPMQFTRMPFGINAAPEIFQKTMESVLVDEKGGPLPGIIIYLDDILIFGKTEEELHSRTECVLKALQKNNLTVNKLKSEFNKTKVVFLGHEISENGVKPAVDKLKAIENFRLPTCKSELRSFLGLVTYIGAAVENLSEKTAKLRDMIRKSAYFVWDPEKKKAFAALKEHIRKEVHERGFFQEEAETHLYTDASPTALGAVLVQVQPNESTNTSDKRVIMCVSKSLTETEKRYPQTHKEALAIVWSVEKLHFYLLGRQFIIYTDHEPLEFIFKQKNASDKRAMTRAEGWALRLSSYNYTLRHVSSEKNIADPLSRICEQEDEAYQENYDNYGLFEVELSFESLCYDWKKAKITEDLIKMETENDEESQELKEAIERGNIWDKWELKGYRQISDELSVVGGMIRRGTLIVPPKSIRKLVVESAHSGHAGPSSMKRHLRAHFWWPRMDDDIMKARQTCETCVLLQKDPPPAPMKRTPMPKSAWDFLALDYYSTEDPLSLKILVMQDYYSKYVKLTFVKSTDTKGATEFLEKAFDDEGMPSRIITDNGPPFQGDEFVNWCKSRKIKVTKSTPALPRANGMIERFMQSLSRVLRALKTNGNLTTTNAFKAVKLLVFTYNRRPHSVTERTPFSLLKGRESSDIFPAASNDQVSQEYEELEPVVTHKQLEGKRYMDKYAHAKDVEVSVGDEVAIKNVSKSKLDSNFKPVWYKVVEKKGTELTLELGGKFTKRNANHVVKRPKQQIENKNSFSPSQNDAAATPNDKESQSSSPKPKTTKRNRGEEKDDDSMEPRPKRIRHKTSRYTSVDFVQIIKQAIDDTSC
jgi:RNase H-like domain found in reverse transcriptase/Reverse transcriptase (RNA-dependent DNA polymerase)/Integrase zinc binding domain/Integrase core domain